MSQIYNKAYGDHETVHLLAILNAFEPDRGGGAAVYSDMCFALARMGVNVTVLAPYPFYPEWRDKSGRNGFRVWKYIEKGVRVRRYGLYIPTNPRSVLERALFELSLTLSLLRALPEARSHDVIMAYCPQVSNVVVSALMRAFYRKPVWLNVQDIATEAAVGTGGKFTRILMKQLRKVEYFLYNRSELWSTISPAMQEKLAPLRRRNQPLSFIPNWADKAMVDAISAQQQLQRQPHNIVQLLYAGNIGAKQDLLRFCRILASSSTNFSFRIFGSGSASSEICEWMDKQCDSRFYFGDFLEPAQLAKELVETDFYVITEKNDIKASFFPSKMVTGMTAGTPILAVCDADSPLGREMQDAEPGIRFDWNSIDRITEFLQELHGNSSDWHRWHENALKRAHYYDRERILTKIRDVLIQMSKSGPMVLDLDEEDMPSRP